MNSYKFDYLLRLTEIRGSSTFSQNSLKNIHLHPLHSQPTYGGRILKLLTIRTYFTALLYRYSSQYKFLILTLAPLYRDIMEYLNWKIGKEHRIRECVCM